MKTLAFRLMVLIVAFFAGVFVSDLATRASLYLFPPTLADITQESEFYDGMSIEIIDYVHLFTADSGIVVLGNSDRDPKFRAMVMLANKIEALFSAPFVSKLRIDFGENSINRVKIRVLGTIRDNCNKSIPCCMGRNVTIFVDDWQIIGNFEQYENRNNFELPRKVITVRDQFWSAERKNRSKFEAIP